MTCVSVQTGTRLPTSHSVVSPLDWYCTDPRSAAMLTVLWEKKKLSGQHLLYVPQYHHPAGASRRRYDQHAPLFWKAHTRGQGTFCNGVSFLEWKERSSRQKKWRQKNLSPTCSISPPGSSQRHFTSRNNSKTRTQRQVPTTTDQTPTFNDLRRDDVVHQRMAAAGL